MVAEKLDPLIAGRWRFAAHLGIASADRPMLAASTGSRDPVDQIARAAALGFTGISDNNLRARGPVTQRRMGVALRDHGLVMGTFTFHAAGEEPAFYWGMPIADMEVIMAGALAAADHVGGGCINAVLLDAGTPVHDQRAWAKDNLARAAEIAFTAGFRLALESVSRTRVPNILFDGGKDVAALIRASGSPYLGLILDSCHCHCSGDDMAALVRAHADWLAAVQIADMPGRVEPGAGGIDFAPIMAALADIGWHGLIEAEFDPLHSGLEGEADALAALNRLG